MKYIYLLPTLLFLSGVNLIAQTELITGLSEPFGIALNGNDLYVAQTNDNKISKIDLSTSPPTITDVITGLDRPFGLALNGNDLYVAEFLSNKISKIDLSASPPTATDFITGLNGPLALLLNGNDLYVALIGDDKVSKIDLTASPPVATDVVTGIRDPTGLALNGNDLYVVERDLNKVLKFDLSVSPPTKTYEVTGFHQPYGLALNGNDLYIAELSGNKISKIDITESSPTATEVVAVTRPAFLQLDNDLLYISSASSTPNGAIYTFDITTLALEELPAAEKPQVIPNPATDVIRIFGLNDNVNYRIYNFLGTEMHTGMITDNGKINIQDFTNGIYFLEIDNGSVVKFIKK